jgi:hypothetical protein
MEIVIESSSPQALNNDKEINLIFRIKILNFCNKAIENLE